MNTHYADTNELLQEIDSGLEFEAIPVTKNIFFKHGELQVPTFPEKVIVPPDMTSILMGQETCSTYTSPSLWPNEEEFKMYRHITEHVGVWSKVLQSPDDLVFKRLNGNSNACFKVALKDHIETPDNLPRAVLYRRYEQKVVDKQVE